MQKPSVPITRLSLIVALVEAGMSEDDAFDLVFRRPDMTKEDCVEGESFVQAWPDFVLTDMLRSASRAKDDIARQEVFVASLKSTMKTFAEVAHKRGWSISLTKEVIEFANRKPDVDA